MEAGLCLSSPCKWICYVCYITVEQSCSQTEALAWQWSKGEKCCKCGDVWRCQQEAGASVYSSLTGLQGNAAGSQCLQYLSTKFSLSLPERSSYTWWVQPLRHCLWFLWSSFLSMWYLFCCIYLLVEQLWAFTFMPRSFLVQEWSFELFLMLLNTNCQQMYIKNRVLEVASKLSTLRFAMHRRSASYHESQWAKDLKSPMS
jgi:hypothetical protein